MTSALAPAARGVCLALGLVFVLAASPARERTPAGEVPLDLPGVRVLRSARGELPPELRGPSLVVSLADGSARWAEDLAADTEAQELPAPRVFVQVRRSGQPAARPADGERPGDAKSVGMSFALIFENDRVSVLRASMEEGAWEGVHTHGADTLILYRSGGQIEETAEEGRRVLRHHPGDVELERSGTRHALRNLGGAVDVVVVLLRP